MTNAVTRRTLLALLPAALPAQLKKRTQPFTAVGEFVAFPDPVTEARVVRLTSPASSSWLPAPQNHFVSVKGRFLICSSDRNGSAAPFQIDLHAGLAHPLGETSALSPQSLCLDDSQRAVYLVDGDALKEIRFANRRMRTIAEDVQAFAPAAGDFMIVRRGRLQLLNAGIVIAENVAPFCLMRPGGSGCLFMREDSPDAREYWLGAISGQQKPVLLAKGRVSSPFWSPGGKSLLFLRDVEGPNGVFAEIHEVAVDGAAERCVAPTSQFAAFAPNADASVFVGASRSKAQPTVILLLRSVNRELTLCEHRASHPAAVSPVFSPDSRRVYFESDREGKQALYSVNVESLVEPTA